MLRDEVHVHEKPKVVMGKTAFRGADTPGVMWGYMQC